MKNRIAEFLTQNKLLINFWVFFVVLISAYLIGGIVGLGQGRTASTFAEVGLFVWLVPIFLINYTIIAISERVALVFIALIPILFITVLFLGIGGKESMMGIAMAVFWVIWMIVYFISNSLHKWVLSHGILELKTSNYSAYRRKILGVLIPAMFLPFILFHLALLIFG